MRDLVVGWLASSQGERPIVSDLSQPLRERTTLDATKTRDETRRSIIGVLPKRR